MFTSCLHMQTYVKGVVAATSKEHSIHEPFAYATKIRPGTLQAAHHCSMDVM